MEKFYNVISLTLAIFFHSLSHSHSLSLSFFFTLIEKVFSFLSKDEIEKLRQEEERKIATLCRDKESRLFDGTNNEKTDKQTSDDESNYVRQSIVHDDDDDDDDNGGVDDAGYVNEDEIDVRQRKHNGSYNDNERVVEEDGNIVSSTVQVLRETYIDHQCTGDEAEDIR